MLSVYLCYPDPHLAEVGQRLTQFTPVQSRSRRGNLARQNPTIYLQYDVLMMRCSVIIYQSFCHFVIFIILLFPLLLLCTLQLCEARDSVWAKCEGDF